MSQPTALYDFHLHTRWSYDATARVEAYFAAARRYGVRCLAITDHHLIDGLDEVHAVAREYPEVRVIRAAELTVTTEFGSIDLLCYGLPDTIPHALQTVLDEYHQWQQAYGAGISAGVRALGLSFTDQQRRELLATYRPAQAIAVQGVTHVRNAVLRNHFVAQGFIQKPDEYGAFMARISAQVALPRYPDVARVVPAVKAAGGLVVIAHPFHYFQKHDLTRMNALRDMCQLDGIECSHPSVPSAYGARYHTYCERHGLFATGGSDCHDELQIDQMFARHGGPAAWLDEFLAAIDNRPPVPGVDSSDSKPREKRERKPEDARV